MKYNIIEATISDIQKQITSKNYHNHETATINNFLKAKNALEYLTQSEFFTSKTLPILKNLIPFSKDPLNLIIQLESIKSTVSNHQKTTYEHKEKEYLQLKKKTLYSNLNVIIDNSQKSTKGLDKGFSFTKDAPKNIERRLELANLYYEDVFWFHKKLPHSIILFDENYVITELQNLQKNT